MLGVRGGGIIHGLASSPGGVTILQVNFILQKLRDKIPHYGSLGLVLSRLYLTCTYVTTLTSKFTTV